MTGGEIVYLATWFSSGVGATGWMLYVWIANDRGVHLPPPDDASVSASASGPRHVADRARRYHASRAALASVSLSDPTLRGSLSDPDR